MHESQSTPSSVVPFSAWASHHQSTTQPPGPSSSSNESELDTAPPGPPTGNDDAYSITGITGNPSGLASGDYDRPSKRHWSRTVCILFNTFFAADVSVFEVVYSLSMY
jgi:hypothetical protein